MRITLNVIAHGWNMIMFMGLICFALNADAQSQKDKLFYVLEGHWNGAFIKDNSYQKFDIQFYKTDDLIKSLQIIEEWHPQFGEFELPVEIDSLGQIRFNTGHGKAIMQLDTISLEMTGQIENSLPAMYVHFKKMASPPSPSYEVIPIEVPNGEVILSGHLHKPLFRKTKTAIIIVGGRGCYAGSTKYDLYGKLLREYGVSVLSFNKRGTGKSTGNCNQATIGDLVSDVNALRNYLLERDEKFQYIGLLGSSAGGWVIAKASEAGKFDFMISIVGPSTSVRDQQLQSMNYGLKFFKLPENSRKDLLEYTNMMFDAKASDNNFDRFNKLLANSKRDDWFQLLEDTDIPNSIEGIDSLWVRRHDYDPGESLRRFMNPFLAIYGEKDWVVPYKENIIRLNGLFIGDQKAMLNTVVAANAGHGTEVEECNVELKNDKSYWRFFRISPQITIELIAFLKKYGIIE
ncbi:MAG: hypothetical protein HKO67_14635 [Flavobacteriaceae bacterium]|nr:hypothetical protein [Flavobacteriaceae bacterium]